TVNPSIANRKLLSAIEVSDRGSASVIPSVCDRPNEQNRMISVSGVLRTTLTYAVPIQLSIGTGASRIAASAVPRISAPTAENTVSWIVVQNASRIWPTVKPGSTSEFTGDSSAVSASAGGWSRRRRCGQTRGAQVLVPRFLPCAVRLHLLECVGDLGAQLGVVLLQADAVVLLRERLADDLERPRS